MNKAFLCLPTFCRHKYGFHLCDELLERMNEAFLCFPTYCKQKYGFHLCDKLLESERRFYLCAKLWEKRCDASFCVQLLENTKHVCVKFLGSKNDAFISL